MVAMFEDRVDAAKKLCLKLIDYKGRKDVVVVGLTKGGVVVACVVADFLKLKLKALVVKKIGAPQNSELAIGAMVSKKDVYWNEQIIEDLKITDWEKEYLLSQKEKEIHKLERIFKIKIKSSDFKNKVVLVVDDGVATGATVMATARYLRENKAREIILATPVISADILVDIKEYFDVVIFLQSVVDFYAVGQFYQSFEQVTDREVVDILNRK